MSPLRRSLTLVVLAASVAVPARSQVTTGTLQGTVVDPSGAVASGASVTAYHKQTGLRRETKTGPEGRYSLPLLSVGSYVVGATSPGLVSEPRGATVTVGETTVVDVRMEFALTDTISVTAETPMVRTTSGELGYLVGEQEVRTLPLNGRNYTDLALLQPGVVAYPHRDGGSVVAHGLGMSVNGQDPRSNVYLLDGTPLNDFTNAPAGSAAGTSLGTETVREFRVETNAYSAEFGRNAGGQIHVVTKSGGNDVSGSVYEYHRNDALDARNFFDGEQKPEFRRNQFGGTVGGPIRKDKTFFFVGVELLRENLGRTVSTIVPDDAARTGVIPDPRNVGQTLTIPVPAAVRPFLDAYPRANGRALGGGLAAYTFPFEQTLDQQYLQLRLDQNVGAQDQLFVRYTFDDAEQLLPTDFPQFPRTFLSRNHFATAEYRRVSSATTFHTARLSYARTRIGQLVQSNLETPLAPFVAGRPLVGDIDIGGIPRFGPQSSGDLVLAQQILGGEYGLVHNHGRHALKAGALVEHYVDDMTNPTFSLGIYTFSDLESFLRNRPVRFIGLTPEAQLDRNWRFTLFGAYLQDDFSVSNRLTLNVGARVEYATLPKDTEGRDSTLVNPTDTAPTLGQLYQNPGADFSPRVGFAWDATGDGRTSVRGGYGLYFNTLNQQNLIVTVTNPPATPRAIIANPTFPAPPFERGVANSIRPVQWDLEYPRVHVFNLAVQREVLPRTVVTLGYAGSRGRHLLRSGDINIPLPQQLPDGTLFYPPTAARPNAAFSTVEAKTSDGESWYNAGILEIRRQQAGGLSFQTSYTFARNVDTTQASTFFSDATNGTTSAMPEPFGIDYNRGPSDYHAKHNLVFNVIWDLPLARTGVWSGWQVAAIGQYRSGSPLTLFVGANRSRSRWSPSIGPGLGLDRPSLAPGRTAESAVTGDPSAWFDPTAFVLPAAGTLGNLGRGSLVGPDLQVLDLSLIKKIPWTRLGSAGRLELRVEAFNVLNHANFGVPALQAFAGNADGERPLASLGRIRNTVTASRQVQLGVRAVF
jgi:Carboxypeptidase regulatory-like domain/TonB dependent receptor